MPRVIIIGGSLGGLFAGNVMRQLGWDVSIHERSAHQLDSRGGGIVLQPEVLEVLRQSGLQLANEGLGVRSHNRVVLRPDGSIEARYHAPQVQTSWALLYSTLRQTFGQNGYQQDSRLSAIHRSGPGSVDIEYADGTRDQADLLIGADGGNSTVRRLLWPQALPRYAGYLAWRGLLPESAMPEGAREVLHGDFGFANNQGSHILGYLVPGPHNDLRPGHRLYNWVWYRLADPALLRQIVIDKNGRDRGYAVPEGLLDPRWRDFIHSEAEVLLPPAFRAVVQATPEPFMQAIRDLAMDAMVHERVILLGDASAIPRPHTAASTAKAASNALALKTALAQQPEDIDSALARWQPAQVELGKSLQAYGQSLGNPLMFGR